MNYRRGITAIASLAIVASLAATPVLAQDADTEQVGEVNVEGLSLDGKTIGVAVIGTDHYWDRAAFNGLTGQLEELGATVVSVDAGRDDQKHVAGLENLLAQQPDAIVNILGTATVIEPIFEKIAEAGIPLFAVDTASDFAINNATSDNTALGTELAEQLVADIGEAGSIAVFNGFYGINVCALRYDALTAVLEGYPEVQILEPELQDVIPNTQEDARKKIQDLLQKYPEGEMSAVWACWDIPGLGTNLAIVDAGRQDNVGFYGVDGDPTVLEVMAQDGQAIKAIASQQPGLIGQISAMNVAKALGGETVAKTTLVPAFLTLPENVEEVRVQLGQVE